MVGLAMPSARQVEPVAEQTGSQSSIKTRLLFSALHAVRAYAFCL